MLSFITSFYRFINPPPEQPFPIEYNAQWHEIETLKYFDQVGRSLLRKQLKKLMQENKLLSASLIAAVPIGWLNCCMLQD